MTSISSRDRMVSHVSLTVSATIILLCAIGLVQIYHAAASAVAHHGYPQESTVVQRQLERRHTNSKAQRSAVQPGQRRKRHFHELVDKATQKGKDMKAEIKKEYHEAKEKAHSDVRFYNYAVIKPFLFLGGYFSLNATLIESLGITANVNAAYPLKKRRVIKEHHLAYKYVSVHDVPTENIGKYFEDVTAWMEEERKKNGGTGKIWVNCMEGVSRSASIVLAYLIKYNEPRMTYDEAFKHVENLRKIRVNPGFKKQLKEWEQKVHGSGAAASQSQESETKQDDAESKHKE